MSTVKYNVQLMTKVYALKDEEIVTLDVTLEPYEEGYQGVMQIINLCTQQGMVALEVVSTDEELIEAWAISREASYRAATETMERLMKEGKEDEAGPYQTIVNAYAIAEKLVKEEKENGNMENLFMRVMDEVEMEFEAAAQEFTNVVEEAERVLTDKNLKDLLKLDNEEAYAQLRAYLVKMVANFGEFPALREKYDNLIERLDIAFSNFSAKHPKTSAVLSVAGQIVKKVASILLGLVTATLESVVVLALATVRGTVAVGNEYKNAAKEIGSIFKRNVFSKFRK